MTMTLEQVIHLLTKKGVMPSRELRQKMADAIVARIAEMGEPVAYSLRWPQDSRLNLGTVFDSGREALEYASKCSGEVEVVPLYTVPPIDLADAQEGEG